MPTGKNFARQSRPEWVRAWLNNSLGLIVVGMQWQEWDLQLTGWGTLLHLILQLARLDCSIGEGVGRSSACPEVVGPAPSQHNGDRS
jgi:hypothetical protein